MSIRIGDRIIAGNGSGFRNQPTVGTVIIPVDGLIRSTTGDFFANISGTEQSVSSATVFTNTATWDSIGSGGDFVELNPTADQEIVVGSGNKLVVQGSFDLEENGGDKALDFSGISGDLHFEHNGEVYGLVDKDQKRFYYDTTNTDTAFTTTGRAGKEIVIKDDLDSLADEITAVEIERNTAGQTLEQWEGAGNPASTFVNDPANTLTEVSLAKDMQLLANDNYSKMIVATENGNDYHFDLLRFQARGGRLVLQTDNLVTRLANIDTAISTAAESGAGELVWPDTYSEDFAVEVGQVWRDGPHRYRRRGVAINVNAGNFTASTPPLLGDIAWQLMNSDDKLDQYPLIPHITGTTNMTNTINGHTIDAFVLTANYTFDSIEYVPGLFLWHEDTDTWVRVSNNLEDEGEIWNANLRYENGSIVSYELSGVWVIYIRTGGTIDASETGNPTPDSDNSGWTLFESGSGGLTVATAFPDSPTVGDDIFLDVAVSHTDGTNQRPRGFYTYVQPSADPASRFWEQLNPSTVGQLYNNARVGDAIYLQADEDNFNTTGNNFTAGFYRAAGNTGADNHTTWTSISAFNGFTLAGTPSTTNSVPKWTDATTLTWSPDTGGTGDVTAIEEEIDDIQAHEDVIDHRLEVLESEVSNLQQTYAGDYTFVGNTVVNTLLTANRVDSQGNNPSIVNNILNSEYNPDSNTLRWWIASTSSDTQIAELIEEATAIGFSDGIKDPIPFVAINSGENLEGTAKYIDFKLQQEATYEATLLSYADETEVVFETTLHFFNTANTNFNQADTDAGDHHRASALTAEQAADLAEIAAVPDSQILTKDADGNIIGTTETGIPLFQTTINLVTSPSDLSGKGDLVQWAFRFGGGNNDPVENYSTVDGGVSWSAHVLSSADVATQFGDILAADQHGVGANTTIHPSSNNELYVQGNGTGQVTLLNIRSINGVIPRDITKATWDSAQFVGTVTSTDAAAITLLHKRIITGNNVTEVDLYGEVGATALTIYNNQDRAVGNTLLTQNYTA